MRNKKVLISALFLAAVFPFLAISLVLANHEDDSKQDLQMKRVELKERVNDKIDQVRSEAADKKAALNEKKNEIKEKRKITAKKMMEAQIFRAERAADRLFDVLKRVNSRREKLALMGGDMAKIDALIAKAQSQKNSAGAALAKAKVVAGAFDSSTDQKVAANSFIASMKIVKRDLSDMQATLRETLKEMKKADELAIPTDSTNN